MCGEPHGVGQTAAFGERHQQGAVEDVAGGGRVYGRDRARRDQQLLRGGPDQRAFAASVTMTLPTPFASSVPAAFEASCTVCTGIPVSVSLSVRLGVIR